MCNFSIIDLKTKLCIFPQKEVSETAADSEFASWLPPESESYSLVLSPCGTHNNPCTIRASVDALCRDDMGQISHDPHT